MNRKTFLKLLGIGSVAAVVAPIVLAKEPEKKAYLPPICYKMDISSIPDGMTAEDIIREWHRSGMLIYQNKPPYRTGGIIEFIAEQNGFLCHTQ